MGLFSKKFETLDELFLNQLQDLYDAEHRIVEALPEMAEQASSSELAQALREHLTESRGHIARLEQAFSLLGKEAEREKCQAITGLIEEGDEIVGAKGDKNVIDAGIIAAAQRVEHYEMAGYGSARTFAERLGHPEIARLLDETLEEEKSADATLSEIAESGRLSAD